MKGSECIFIKILLIVIALLLLLLLFSKITVTIGYSENFYYKLSVYGLPIKPEWFIKGHKKEKKKPYKKKKKAKKTKPQGNAQTQQTDKQDKSVFTASLILNLLKSVAQNLPRAFRIKLCNFKLIIGGEDAADVALNYGRLYALLSASLGLLENYRGLFYGFRVRRSDIILKADFTKSKSEFTAKLKISCFLWQLLFAAVRVGIVFIMEIIRSEGKNTENTETELQNN